MVFKNLPFHIISVKKNKSTPFLELLSDVFFLSGEKSKKEVTMNSSSFEKWNVTGGLLHRKPRHVVWEFHHSYASSLSQVTDQNTDKFAFHWVNLELPWYFPQFPWPILYSVTSWVFPQLLEIIAENIWFRAS